MKRNALSMVCIAALCLAGCNDDEGGSAGSADASGDSSNTNRDGAADGSDDARMTVPDARVTVPDATITIPDATITIPDATIEDGMIVVPDATISVPDAMVTVPDATIAVPDAAAPECRSAEDCKAPGNVCKDGTLTMSSATCDPTTGCGISTKMLACKSDPSLCKGTTFISYEAVCATPSTCGGKQVETVTDCPDSPDVCSGGELTQYEPICDDAKGCGRSGRTSSCPDVASTCGRVNDDLVLTTYEPRCANGSSCGKPQGTQTVCDAKDECRGDVFIDRTPTCDEKNETCGAREATTDCAGLDTCEIANFGGGCIVAFADGQCNANSGCSLGKVTQVACTAPQSCSCKTKGCI